MIGVDLAQRSFCIAFAFLNGETEADYTQALERLKLLYEQYNAILPSIILTDRCFAVINAASTLFPTATTLFCIWHANKAILIRCQPAFPEATEWKEFYNFQHSIIGSPTEEEYTERFTDFQQKYVFGYREEVGYVKTTWLIPFKEKLVRTWVDQSIHFGNTVTSRIEGIHALFKSYLKRSTFDLFETWKTIQLAFLNQLSELQARQAQQQVRTLFKFSKTLYRMIYSWVLYKALKKVEKQRKLFVKDPFPACIGTFSRIYGLLCVHILSTRQGEPLLFDHFHTHWHLMRKGTLLLLFEPRQRIEPIQARSSFPRSNTKRKPSQFEVVEAQIAWLRRAPSQYTKCNAVGYTRTSRVCPLRYSDILQLVVALELTLLLLRRYCGRKAMYLRGLISALRLYKPDGPVALMGAGGIWTRPALYKV